MLRCTMKSLRHDSNVLHQKFRQDRSMLAMSHRRPGPLRCGRARYSHRGVNKGQDSNWRVERRISRWICFRV